MLLEVPLLSVCVSMIFLVLYQANRLTFVLIWPLDIQHVLLFSDQVKQKPVPWTVPWKARICMKVPLFSFCFEGQATSEKFWLCCTVSGQVWDMVDKCSRLSYPLQSISFLPCYCLGSYNLFIGFWNSDKGNLIHSMRIEGVGLPILPSAGVTTL